jgi:hypothetical protein
MADRQLTARGVEMMLTRAGVDYSGLEIYDDPTLWRDLDTGRTSTNVVVKGAAEARRAAFHILFDRGLSVAPYSDRDEWSRRGAARRASADTTDAGGAR